MPTIGSEPAVINLEPNVDIWLTEELSIFHWSYVNKDTKQDVNNNVHLMTFHLTV